MPSGPYRATTCRERGLTLDHLHTFLPHKNMEDFPSWGKSSMPRPPPWQHEHERRDTPFTQPFILTRRIWKDDYDGQMIFGDLVGLKLPDICLTGEEKPRRQPHPGNLSRPGIKQSTSYRSKSILILFAEVVPKNQSNTDDYNYNRFVTFSFLRWEVVSPSTNP